MRSIVSVGSLMFLYVFLLVWDYPYSIRPSYIKLLLHSCGHIAYITNLWETWNKTRMEYRNFLLASILLLGGRAILYILICSVNRGTFKRYGCENYLWLTTHSQQETYMDLVFFQNFQKQIWIWYFSKFAKCFFDFIFYFTHKVKDRPKQIIT